MLIICLYYPYNPLMIIYIRSVLLQKNISPPITRRRDMFHYFFRFFANRDAPTTRMTAAILMNKAYGSTV
jgi:hypothetical protein